MNAGKFSVKFKYRTIPIRSSVALASIDDQVHDAKEDVGQPDRHRGPGGSNNADGMKL